jgi:quinol---cytochrome-c reductase cytochrome c subunit
VTRGARSLCMAAAACAAVGLLVLLVAPGAGLGAGGEASSAAAHEAVLAHGRALYLTGCSSCHGDRAEGVHGVAPSLRGVGAIAADFYLQTGRMPLDSPADEPVRSKPAYTPAQIAALDAYIGSFGGPPIPHVSLAGSSLSRGEALFMDDCSGCHQAAARGGIVPGAFAPALDRATARQIVEAARIGPYLMPRFGPRLLTAAQLASISRYVHYTQTAPDRGGWGIGHIGPVPEGMIVWFVAIPFVLLMARLIGEREEA